MSAPEKLTDDEIAALEAGWRSQYGCVPSRFARVLAELRASRSPERVGDWRPIETAPKDGTPVVVYCPDNVGDGCEGMKVAFWSDPTVGDTQDDEAGWYDWEGAGNCINGTPTLYRLIAPPRSPAGDGG